YDILYSYSIDSAIIVGVSMGGVIAQSFAINHEHKVNQLILSDTFCELKSLKEKMLGYSQVVGFHIFKLLGRKMLSKGMASTYKFDFAYHAKEYFTSNDRILDFQQLILARKAINKADFKGGLTNLRVPSLVLVGNEFCKDFVEINKKLLIILLTLNLLFWKKQWTRHVLPTLKDLMKRYYLLLMSSQNIF